jgi:hypothetical protein
MIENGILLGHLKSMGFERDTTEQEFYKFIKK